MMSPTFRFDLARCSDGQHFPTAGPGEAERTTCWTSRAPANVISLKLVKHGGLLATRDVAAVAQAAGIGRQPGAGLFRSDPVCTRLAAGERWIRTLGPA
jgi:hypothetical protein